MIHNVKFFQCVPGAMVGYETGREFDMQVSHTSLRDLKDKLRRPGMSLLQISQRSLYVNTEQDYNQLATDRVILVGYRPSDISPLMYDGFQG